MKNFNKIKQIILKYKGYILCILVILLSLISIYIKDSKKNNNKYENGDIGVYITGEVINPGVYYLPNNKRLCDLLDLAGGVTKDADINSINLALKLKDGDKINILKIKEEDSNKDIENDKININTASKEELMSLDGIGSSTADKIIEYRTTATFETIEEIMNIKAIGISKFNAIKNGICVE